MLLLRPNPDLSDGARARNAWWNWDAGANNYLGLSNHPLLVEAAAQALRTHGYGLSSVRFICGTQVRQRSVSGRQPRTPRAACTMHMHRQFIIHCAWGHGCRACAPDDACLVLSHASVV